MIDRATFVERRRSGIGGSDIAAIVGLSPFATAYDVWRSKVEPDAAREAEISGKMAVRLGVELEDFAARIFTEATGKRVQRCNHQFAAPEVPYFIANLDRVVKDGNTAPVVRGELRTREIVECKTSSMRGEWGEPGSAEIPEHYLCQTQWQMGVTGAAVVWVPVVFLTVPYAFELYRVERDEDTIAYLFQQGGEFWRHVASAEPPPVQTYADAARRWSGSAGDSVTADASLMAAIADYKQMTAIIDEAERTRDVLKARICAAMGDATELRTEDGRKLASWSASKEGTKIDYKGIVEELAPNHAIIQKYSQTYNTARRFTLAGK